MASRYTLSHESVAFIRRVHPFVNAICADQLLHDLGATSYVAKARIMARIEPDHVHRGSRYWRTADLIDAFAEDAQAV